MSVVVWDGKTLAADRQASCGDLRMLTCKIRRLPSGEVVAWTGEVSTGMILADWYERGAKPEEWPKFQEGENWSRLIVASPGKLVTYEGGPYPVAIPVLEKKAAFGSGRDFALGAMAWGADAEGAVTVASHFCASCGLGVDFETVE